MSGIVETLPGLVALRHPATALDLERGRKVLAPLAGPYRSAYRGRGVEFDEVRAYQPGDDVRSIDWRVTARTGRVYSKLFHEERERPVWLFVDAGASMRFGTRRAFKSVTAARAAALLGWCAHRGGDRIGTLVRGVDGLDVLDPKAGQNHWFAVLALLAQATQREPRESAEPLAEALVKLHARVRPGSRVFVLSDFYGLGDDAWRPLDDLARFSDVTCVLVHDPLEASAPPPGRYRVSDGARVQEVAPRRDRAWGAAFAERRDALRDFCLRRRIPLASLATDGDAVGTLAGLLDPALGRAA